MENYHKHTSYSNIFTPDSAVTIEQYAKRAVELGQKSLSSCEHGFCGNVWQTKEIAEKYGLKWYVACEPYWVKDRHEADRTNAHIILMAKNENGRQDINEILSTANEDGYYYKPRIDLELLMKLTPTDVFCTSACCAFWQYDDIDDIVLQLQDHFKDNFALEIQSHNTDRQKEVNRHIKELSAEYDIDMIVGLDSHYIYSEQAEERDELLAAKGIHYDEEDGWSLDYPDEATVMQRFMEQGVFTQDEVQKAMDKSDIILTFEDYHSQVFEKNRKLPTLYPGKTQEEKNKIYSRLITKLFKEYIKNIPADRYDEYYQGVKMEVDTYKSTGMVDYPLLDYEIVKLAKSRGGMITRTGRGSAVGYFTNTLCGFSSVDRFQSPIKLYPERFISKTRIMESNSLPDIDMNLGNPEVFEQAQKDILGEDHAYPMIAFGTLKKKAAFKLYARAQHLDFDIANEISKQIEKYDDAIKYAEDDDERDSIDIHDFVDEKYWDYLEKSKPYWGIISDKKRAPCAFMLYSGSIRREIGLIKCKSDSTKKEYITTVCDGAVAENYKFLKNDLLKVDVVYLIEKLFERIGIEPFSVPVLIKKINNDKSTWNIYSRGLTQGINQCEKSSTTEKLKKYKPQNLSELAAFIAAIRPGFKSMYSKFASREPFSYGIPSLDAIIQTKEFPYSYILYQENLMSVLNFAGFPLDKCYGIIKDIAKKHPEKVRPLKEQFINRFKEKIKSECPLDKTPDEIASNVWTIINDATAYSFNSAHAESVALDSLYCAYLKAHYPYEFYEVLEQLYSDKGNKDKVALLKQEMLRGFGIYEGEYKFGLDNRTFKADSKHHCIYPSLLSIKGLSKGTAEALYKLGKQHFDSFFELWKVMSKIKGLAADKINTLIMLNYFSDFGKRKKLKDFIAAIDEFYGRTQFPKDSDSKYIEYIKKHCVTETKKQYREFDSDAALNEIWNNLPDEDVPVKQVLDFELEKIGYCKTTVPTLSPSYYYILSLEGKYTNKNLTLYNLRSGDQLKCKIKGSTLNTHPIAVGDIIRVDELREEGKWSKDDSGQWVQSTTDKELVLRKYVKTK